MIEHTADAFLVIEEGPRGDMELQLDAAAFVPNRYPRTTDETSVNGVVIGRMVFRETGRLDVLRLRVPAKVISASSAMGSRRVVQITFEVLPPGPRYARVPPASGKFWACKFPGCAWEPSEAAARLRRTSPPRPIARPVASGSPAGTNLKRRQSTG